MDVILYLVFLIIIFYLSSILFSSSNKSDSDDKNKTQVPEKPAEELKIEPPTQVQQKTQPQLSEEEIDKIVNEAKASQEYRNKPPIVQTSNSYDNVKPRFKVNPKPTARIENTKEDAQVKQSPSSSSSASTAKNKSSSPYMTEYEKGQTAINEGLKNGKYHITHVTGNARSYKSSGQSKKPSYLQPTVKQPKQPNKPRTADINPDKLDSYPLPKQRLLLTQYYENHYFQSNDIGEIGYREDICPHDGHMLFRADTFYKSKFYKQVLCCQKCHTIYPYEKIKFVDFTEGNHILFVCKTHTTGKKHDHKVISVTGFLGIRGGNKIQVNIAYCYDCHRFYMYYEQYKIYQNKYGRDIMGDIFFLDGPLFVSKSIIKTESILHKYGYNVNINSKMNQSDRLNILEWLIDHKIVNKDAIISYLSDFITRGEKILSWHTAVTKWKSDLEWIQEYELDSQKETTIKDIRKWN